MLKISRTHDGEESLLSEKAVTLTPGKNVFKVDTKLDKTGAYNYRAEFIADDKESDYMHPITPITFSGCCRFRPRRRPKAL